MQKYNAAMDTYFKYEAIADELKRVSSTNRNTGKGLLQQMRKPATLGKEVEQNSTYRAVKMFEKIRKMRNNTDTEV